MVDKNGEAHTHEFDNRYYQKRFERGLAKADRFDLGARPAPEDPMAGIISGFPAAGDFEGGEAVANQILGVSGRKRKDPLTGKREYIEPTLRFDGSGATSASEYAGTRGAELSSHPAFGALYTAHLTLKDPSARKGARAFFTWQQGSGKNRIMAGDSRVHVASIAPHTRLEHTVRLVKGHEDKLPKGLIPAELHAENFIGKTEHAHPETGEKLVTLHHESGKSITLPRKSVRISSTPVSGIIAGPLGEFIRDSEVHNLSYKERADAPKKFTGETVVSDAGRTVSRSRPLTSGEAIDWYNQLDQRAKKSHEAEHTSARRSLADASRAVAARTKYLFSGGKWVASQGEAE